METMTGERAQVAKSATLNRTIVGWKHGYPRYPTGMGSPLNRTIVGWKRLAGLSRAAA